MSTATALRRGRPVLIGVVTAMAAMLGLSGVSVAQPGNMGRMMEPPVTSTQVERLAEMTGVGEAESELMLTLHESFLSEHEEAVTQLREIFRLAGEEAERTGDSGVWMEVQAKAMDFWKFQQSLRKKLYDDMKLLLTEEQLESWPRWERLQRREYLLGYNGMGFGGSAVDLTDTLRSLETSAELSPEDLEAAAGDTLLRYELELDRLLVEFEKLSIEQMEQWAELMSNGKGWFGNMAAFEELFDEGRKGQVEIGELTRRYARSLASRLEGQAGEAFMSSFNRRAWPGVYGESFVDAAIEAAEGFDDLTDDQRTQLESAASAYERAVEQLNERLAEATTAHRTEAGMMELFGGGSGSAAVRELEKEKTDLQERSYERVTGILTSEQADRLPERGEQDWRERATFGR